MKDIIKNGGKTSTPKKEEVASDLKDLDKEADSDEESEEEEEVSKAPKKIEVNEDTVKVIVDFGKPVADGIEEVQKYADHGQSMCIFDLRNMVKEGLRRIIIRCERAIYVDCDKATSDADHAEKTYSKVLSKLSLKDKLPFSKSEEVVSKGSEHFDEIKDKAKKFVESFLKFLKERAGLC